jgi:hypothetical protein
MAQLEQVVRTVIENAELKAPLVRQVGRTFAKEVTTALAPDGARIPADVYQSLLHFLAAIHGFACLEPFGHLSWFSEKARDELFEAQIELLARTMSVR